jgi:hypothetical protein
VQRQIIISSGLGGIRFRNTTDHPTHDDAQLSQLFMHISGPNQPFLDVEGVAALMTRQVIGAMEFNLGA